VADDIQAWILFAVSAEEIALDVDALILDHARGQRGVKTTGNKSQSPALLRHCSRVPLKNVTL